MNSVLIKRTGQDDFPAYIKALVLGDPKAGKSSFASTFPNVVIADLEHGLMSIAHKNVPYVEVDHTSKLQSLLLVLSDDELRARAAQQLGLDEIESVAIDTVDSLQAMLIQERLQSEKKTQMAMADWGWLLEQFQSIVQAFLSLPLNVCLTAHTSTTVDDEMRVIRVPALQGQAKDKIAGWVGFSMYIERSTEIDPKTGDQFTAHRLLTEGDNKNPHLGNRAAGRLPRVIEPYFDVIKDAVYANLQLAQGKRTQVELGRSGAATAAQEQVAQNPSQPSGTPAVPDDELINATALQYLTKAYGEANLAVPDSINEWTMGKARTVAEWFKACKTDRLNGQIESDQAMIDAIVDGLQGMAAYDGDVEEPVKVELAEEIQGNVRDILARVGDDVDLAKTTLAQEKSRPDGNVRSTLVNGLMEVIATVEVETEVQTEDSNEDSDQEGPQETEDEPALEEGPEPDDPQPAGPTVDDEEAKRAEAILVEELGATVVDTPDEVCNSCGEDLDDPDIAILAVDRFDVKLCVDCFIGRKNS